MTSDALWYGRIEQLSSSKRFPEALEECRAYCAKHTLNVAGSRLCAELNFRCGNRDEGFRYAAMAVEGDPSDIRYGLDCAFNLVRDGRRQAALAIAELLATQSFADPYLRDALGTMFTFCEEPGKAAPHFEQAVGALPNIAAFRYNLASVQRMLGADEDAGANLDRAIEIEPANGQYQLARSSLRRQTPQRNHVAELKLHLQDSTLAGAARIDFQYALAKELEDLGQYPESFEALSAGASQYRALLTYDLDAELGYMEHLRCTDYGRIVPRPTAELSPRPIFVMGLPRSGTTLVDRIISSVPGVTSTGESKALSAAIWHQTQRARAPGQSVGDTLAQMLAHPDEIAGSYYKSLAHLSESKAAIDKTPSNYLFAGFIDAAMPKAKMVCLRRDPMDTCYSIFKTLFHDAYQFSYSLEEIARYYVAWDALIRQWESAIGRNWLTVRYEELVNDPEPVMRRIISHCELPWDERCLTYYESKKPVTSASAGQANRPIYSDSIGMWKRYSRELDLVAAHLDAAGIEFQL